MIDVYAHARTFHPWWPDWRGKTAVIVASGHSAKENDVSLYDRDVRVAVVGQNVDLYPYADVVYSCDENWWVHRKGLPEFHGLKITAARNAAHKYPTLKKIEVKNENKIFTKPKFVGSGGNSGFQLFNLVIQFGASRIVLLGFDMDPTRPLHWYGKNTWRDASNPNRGSFDRWRASLDGVAEAVRDLGVEVVNAGMGSTLTAFPKIPMREALCRFRA